MNLVVRCALAGLEMELMSSATCYCYEVCSAFAIYLFWYSLGELPLLPHGLELTSGRPQPFQSFVHM